MNEEERPSRFQSLSLIAVLQSSKFFTRLRRTLMADRSSEATCSQNATQDCQMKLRLPLCVISASLIAASPSFALDLSGSYEAQFAVANGTQKPVCFVLSSTGAKRSYRDAGTVTSPTYPKYSGFYVVYQNTFHLTFLDPDHASVTITGVLSQAHLVTTAATQFRSSGEVTNVGTLTEKKGCSS